MAVNTYEKGDLVRCSVAFTNSAGTALDPTAVLFSYRLAGTSATIHTYGVDAGLVKDSVGNYHDDVSAVSTGTWYYRWYSTGTGQSADEGAFNVRTSQF